MMRRTLGRSLVATFAALAALVSPAAAQIAGSVNWSTLGVTDENVIPSGTTQTSVGVTSTITWSTVTDGGSFIAYAGNNFVSYETTAQGGIANFAQIGFDNERQDADDKVTLNVAFSEPVRQLAFTLTDIDQSSWDDFVEVYYNTGSGFVNARVPVTYATSIGPAAAADDETFGDGWEGTASSASTSTDGNIVFSFGALEITAIRIVYFSGNDAGGNNYDPGGQQLGVGNITFNKVMPNLSVSKTVIVSSLSSSTYAVPGSDVVYTISAQNLGNGRVDNNALFIVDRLPSELTFYNADMDGGGPATTAVYFTQSAGTGLTFTPATDLRYSNAVGAPANFAACTYTPSAGYDANVRHICVNPKGTMMGGSPVKSFTLSFRAQIK
ncbi:MAG: hypothetical protein ABL957_08750 [Parvularculaceae bacterium]